MWLWGECNEDFTVGDTYGSGGGGDRNNDKEDVPKRPVSSPLVYALLSGKKWEQGISRLLSAFPDDFAAETLPLVGQCADPTTVYRLLSFDPACMA